MYRFILYLFLFFSAPCLMAQIRLEGKVTDARTGDPVPFVNIGIRGKNIGTISGETGSFVIGIPALNEKDTLRFSVLGYREEALVPKTIASAKPLLVKLKRENIQLAPIEISAKKLVEKKFGNKKDPFLNFVDASIDQQDIFEIAQVIDLPEHPSKVTSLNLFIAEDSPDSATFRINFYEYADNTPGKRLNSNSILQVHALKKGWLTFDLKKYQLQYHGTVVAAIEFIPAARRARQFFYEIKLGGFSRSFFRENSFGEWQVPPHQYRMFLTAMVSDENGTDPAPEELIPEPAFSMYSSSVKDSFFIYVSLPDEPVQNSSRLPVIYLLDGNFYFPPMIQILERMRKKKQLQPCILVGVGYRNFWQMDSLRDRDYSYPEALEKDSFGLSGGAGNFYRFFEKELVPRIEKNYPAADSSQRVIMGHSLGGFFTLFALDQQLEKKNNLFSGFISVSPSVEYHNSYIISKLKQNKSETTRFTSKVYMARGSDEEDSGDANKKYANEFSRAAALLMDLQMRSEIYNRASHMQTALPGFEKGLKFVLDRRD